MVYQHLVPIGILLVIVGIALLIAGSMLSAKTSVKWGFGGFIGPFPFGWANDPKILPWIIALSVIAVAIFIATRLR